MSFGLVIGIVQVAAFTILPAIRSAISARSQKKVGEPAAVGETARVPYHATILAVKELNFGLVIGSVQVAAFITLLAIPIAISARSQKKVGEVEAAEDGAEVASRARSAGRERHPDGRERRPDGRERHHEV